MGDRLRSELQVDERHVGRVRKDAASTDRRHMRRGLPEPVLEDRKIVWTEVPRNADVRLVEAQVDATGADEVDLADLARVDQVPNLVHGRAVQERVARHEHQS